MDYIYNENDIVKTKNGKIKIIYRFKKGKNNYKYYEYMCMKCGNKDCISESNLKMLKGCNVCSGRKVVSGLNDINTTDPWMCKYFVNKEETYKYKNQSNKRTTMICPECGFEKEMKIEKLYNNGFFCPICSSNSPYSNRIMSIILNELNVDFISEYSPKWISPKRYDFYFKLNNKEYIVEMDGGWHTNYNSISGKTVEESIREDKYKDLKAKEHGIKIIRIDCAYKNNTYKFEYIKNNIIKSELSNIFDFDKIDWLYINSKSEGKIVKEVCDYWNKGLNTDGISKKINLHVTTVRRYLIRGNKIGWCKYNGKDNIRASIAKSNKYKSKKVICITTGETFNSLTEACKKYNIATSNLSKCCKGERKYCGTDKNGNKLLWKYI